MENKFECLCDLACELGAYKAAIISVDKITTDAGFRKMCEANLCGRYGKSYTCPPDVGAIDTLIAKLKGYDHALVYQTVGMLEDSFDIEGMQDAAKKHCQLILELMKRYPDGVLHLGAGGCPLCERCAKATNEPCRHPEHAIASLEAHGVNVSELARSCSMKYINGQNTVTYFAAMLFKENFNA